MLNLISAPTYGNHQKQDQKHHCMTANHLKVFCDHHCTLVHPCKTEHLQNCACFPFHASWMNVKICVQLEEVEICCWTSHLSAWLARKATMGGQLPSSDDPSSSTRKTFDVILWLKCLQASQELHWNCLYERPSPSECPVLCWAAQTSPTGAFKKTGHWLNLVDNSKDCDHVTCHVIDDCEDTDNNNNDIWWRWWMPGPRISLN